MCVVPDALEHIRGEGNPLIDETICSEVGQPLNEPSLQQLQVYPLKNVIFYAQIPYMRHHVMIRLFHFLIADLGISFTSQRPCDHLPLFELGSCHFKQYIVNLAFPTLPLANTLPEYDNLAPISKMQVYVS